MISRNFLLGVVGGSILGAAVGLMLAPRTGEELRTLLRGGASRLLSGVVNYFQATEGTHVNVAYEGPGSISAHDQQRANEIMREANSILNNLKSRKEA